jgi:hypothetical protein
MIASPMTVVMISQMTSIEAPQARGCAPPEMDSMMAEAAAKA